MRLLLVVFCCASCVINRVCLLDYPPRDWTCSGFCVGFYSGHTPLLCQHWYANKAYTQSIRLLFWSLLLFLLSVFRWPFCLFVRGVSWPVSSVQLKSKYFNVWSFTSVQLSCNRPRTDCILLGLITAVSFCSITSHSYLFLMKLHSSSVMRN